MLNNKMIGIFEEQEDLLSKAFISKFNYELEIFNKLLQIHENFITATSNKIKDTDQPNWSILLLLSQVLPLMNNAIQLLSKGYLRSVEALIRICGEAIILSVYFKEFPGAEEDYRKLDHWIFFRKHKIREMLKKVQSSGKYFFKSATKKNKNLYEIMFTNLYKEACRFVHNNPDLIYDITKIQIPIKGKEDGMILGPQLYPDKVLSMSFKRLFNTVIVSIVVFGLSLNVIADDNELSILKEANKLTDNLKS